MSRGYRFGRRSGKDGALDCRLGHKSGKDILRFCSGNGSSGQIAPPFKYSEY